MSKEKICCGGPITRVSGNEYRCQCGRDVTDAFRSSGLAGEVILWIGKDAVVIDEKGQAHYKATSIYARGKWYERRLD